MRTYVNEDRIMKGVSHTEVPRAGEVGAAQLYVATERCSCIQCSREISVRDIPKHVLLGCGLAWEAIQDVAKHTTPDEGFPAHATS